MQKSEPVLLMKRFWLLSSCPWSSLTCEVVNVCLSFSFHCFFFVKLQVFKVRPAQSDCLQIILFSLKPHPESIKYDWGVKIFIISVKVDFQPGFVWAALCTE